ncbi:HNH endonuclease [Burkholderia gladioli]|uniref:HNH endonuclease n=1 Tax=Burkholderia gladioli TaxID=28095 RepID=UPI00163E2854|nr:HNH endonuclease [Burkholderia gladioli]
MIKLNRPSEPSILATNKAKWLSDLESSVKKYGSYKAIPDDEKERLVCFYRHSDIKDSLEKSSLGKCAFCESKPAESGNIEVEHFAPKSIYYRLTFDWINFLPCCRKCNGLKATHDTLAFPIVNPYDQDPRDYFYFVDISLRPIPGANYKVAAETIEVCGLDATRLLRPRAKLLIAIRQFVADLNEALTRLSDAQSAQSRSRRLRKLAEAIDRIENEMHPSQSHSSFIRSIVEKEEAYTEARRLIANNA